MSPKNSQNASKAKANPNLKSSIVHKPFATGTVNIFNPHRHQAQNRQNASNLTLNKRLAEPEAAITTQNLESAKIGTEERNWFDVLLNPWSISAIAIVIFANLISGATIWRNHHSIAETEVKSDLTLGSADLAAEEFMPLNLSTLSVLEPTEDIAEAPVITPIAPALAPLNSAAVSSLNQEYYYILSEYSGDRSITLARQKVKQVSLVNFPEGVFIYLGAFKERDRATEFISRLAEENFTAQIYPFD